MSRLTAFRFTLEPTIPQEKLLRRMGGAARLAYNTCLAAVKQALDEREMDSTAAVPWTPFDLINTINAWKRE